MLKATIQALALAVTPLVAIAAVPAYANPVREFQSIEVGVSDLDLATPAGQKTLQARINRAARDICRVDELQTGSHIPSRDAMACYRAAQRSAAQRVAEVAGARQVHGG